ncbi:hypothetical protein [Streptomyces carminius]|uniref:hypothetical protein n=1 Tax=Streptomyces carminius TaxID=2665496 RepID=UPI001303FB00|nr:hypothetical protein [Streptomyces carminius]
MSDAREAAGPRLPAIPAPAPSGWRRPPRAAAGDVRRATAPHPGPGAAPRHGGAHEEEL